MVFSNLVLEAHVQFLPWSSSDLPGAELGGGCASRWDVFCQAGQQGGLGRSVSIQGDTREMPLLSWPWHFFVPTERQAEVCKPVPAQLPPHD